MNELCLRTATAPAVVWREREFNGQDTIGSGEEPHGNCNGTQIIIEMALAGDPKPLMRRVNENRRRNSPAISEYSESPRTDLHRVYLSVGLKAFVPSSKLGWWRSPKSLDKNCFPYLEPAPPRPLGPPVPPEPLIPPSPIPPSSPLPLP